MNTIPQRARKRQLSTSPIFFTHMFRRNSIPFYIGKGHGRRIEQHFACVRKHEACKHRVCRVIRKAEREKEEITVEKIAEDIPEKAAFQLECLFISLGAIYRWPLVNQTLGGEGVSGYVRDAEWSRRRRELTQQLMADGKFDHLKDLNITNHLTPEIIERRSESIRRAWSDPDLVEQQRQMLVEKASHSEYREIRRQRMKEAYQANPDLRKQKGEQSKQQWDDPDYRAKMQTIMTQPEVKDKLRMGRFGKLPTNTKTYTGFLAPDRITVYENVFNLAAFCREHHLSKPKMCLVAQGKKPQYKGWTLYPPLVKEEKPPVYYHTAFCSPSGEVFDKIESLTAFCREHGLQHSNMVLVAQEKQLSHKGWTRFTDNDQPQQEGLF